MTPQTSGTIWIAPQTTTVTPNLPIQVAQPWECPRCHAMKAPHVSECRCVGVVPYFPQLPATPFTWPSGTITVSTGCLWDGVPEGQSMGMVCMCQKCTAYSAVTQ